MPVIELWSPNRKSFRIFSTQNTLKRLYNGWHVFYSSLFLECQLWWLFVHQNLQQDKRFEQCLFLCLRSCKFFWYLIKKPEVVCLHRQELLDYWTWLKNLKSYVCIGKNFLIIGLEIIANLKFPQMCLHLHVFLNSDWNSMRIRQQC